tara:strand:- start:546 stop:1061 length:516 start_codon:yes stop_codon:yes gene_type:complete
MSNNQELTQKLEIENFKEQFLQTFGLNVYVYTEQEPDFKISLDIFHHCTLIALRNNLPEYNYLKNLKTKTRFRPYLAYVQAMSFMAFKEGHSKSSIALSIKRTHATVINSIRVVEDGFFCKDRNIVDAFNHIIKEIEIHVGTIPENLKSKPNTKSSSDPIWDEARRIINQS